MASTDDPTVSIQSGTNCCGETVVRALLHQIELTSRQEVDAMVRTLMRAHTVSKSSSSCKTPRHGRCILDIEQCVLNRHMEDLLREAILKRPDAFDGLDVLGEDESAQAARLELISNSNMRFMPPASMTLQFATIFRDALRGNRGRLDYVSLSYMPITAKASKIIFEQGLRSTRRNQNLGGLMLRGCAFEDEASHDERGEEDQQLGPSNPAQYLARGLKLNTTLKFLDVSLVYWTDRQLETILNSIVGHPTLTKLDLEGSVFGLLSIQALKNLLQSPRCRLKVLDLSHLNHVRDIGKELTPLDREGLMDALDASHSLEQVMLNHNNCCSYVDLSRIIRLLRRHPHICQVGFDDFIPDGTPRMKTIGLRSTIRTLLHRNRSGHGFIMEAARAGTIPSVWPHCLGRTNRILRTNCQQAHALFPLVQAFFGVPGAIRGTNDDEWKDGDDDSTLLLPPNPTHKRGRKR
jgi:hypothetical protein